MKVSDHWVRSPLLNISRVCQASPRRNSMGFHVPQETARVLAEAIDYARQGQLAAKALCVAPVAAHK